MNGYSPDYNYLQYSGSPSFGGFDEDGTHYSDGEGSYPQGGLANDPLDLMWTHSLEEEDMSETLQSYPLSRGPSTSTTMSNFPSSPMALSVDSFSNGCVVDGNNLDDLPQQPLPCSFNNNTNALAEAQSLAMNANYYGAGHTASPGFNSGTTSPDFAAMGSFDSSWAFNNAQSFHQVRSPLPKEGMPMSNPQYDLNLGQLQYPQIPQTMAQSTYSQEQWENMSNETVVGPSNPMAYSPSYWTNNNGEGMVPSNTSCPTTHWSDTKVRNMATSGTSMAHPHALLHKQRKSRRQPSPRRNPKQRDTAYICKVEGCHAKPFGRRADLDRHHKQIHCPENEKEAYHCDYPKCSRASSAFSRRDHFRDHYRGFHREDVEKRGVADSRDWYTERNTYKKWWRCSKCLHRVHVDKHGFQCPGCGGECTQIRRDIRKSLP